MITEAQMDKQLMKWVGELTNQEGIFIDVNLTLGELQE